MKRSVVISGVGAVSALGLGARALWEGLEAGRSGIGPISRFDASGFPCSLGGEVKDASGSAEGFSAKDYVPKHYRKAVKVMARDIELAVAAAKFAVDDAKLATRGAASGSASGSTSGGGEGAASGGEAGGMTYPGERMACHIGAGFIAAETQELTMAMATSVEPGEGHEARTFSLRRWGTAEPVGEGTGAPTDRSMEAPEQQAAGGGMLNLQPLWMLKFLPNMLACHVTIIHGLEGPSNTLLNGEASGLLSMGESLRVLQRGAADLGFAGSAESKLNPMGLVRMDAGGRLADLRAMGDAGGGDDQNALDPHAVLQPFSKCTRGGIIGEGGGVVILEDEASARARGATIYARVIGFGAGHSALPVLPPGLQQKPDAEVVNAQATGLANAIRAALRDARIDPLMSGQDGGAIDAVVPQGSGVPFIDEAEGTALRTVFGARAPTIPLVCAAPFVGDCAAGNGGVQAAIGAMCLLHRKTPAGATFLLDGSRISTPRSAESSVGGRGVRRILLCSTGVSGQNAAIVLEAV